MYSFFPGIWVCSSVPHANYFSCLAHLFKCFFSGTCRSTWSVSYMAKTTVYPCWECYKTHAIWKPVCWLDGIKIFEFMRTRWNPNEQSLPVSDSGWDTPVWLAALTRGLAVMIYSPSTERGHSLELAQTFHRATASSREPFSWEVPTGWGELLTRAAQLGEESEGEGG